MDPKTRVISASDFRDRVVHHALCNIIEPIFDKTFIFDSYANRKGKGTLAALERFDMFKRKVSKNGTRLREADDNNMVAGFALKADIRHYFHTVDQKILLRIINRKVKDGNVIWLIRKILDNHITKISGKGMPIGNLTSQFFANVYLNELDYFVKHELKAKHYIRYVDDFIVLRESKNILQEYKDAINEFLINELKLELHPEKSRIYPLHKGVKLLGFRCFYHFRIPKKSNIRHFEKRMFKFRELFDNGKIDYMDIWESIEGWLAYASLGNTHKMRNNISKRARIMFRD